MTRAILIVLDSVGCGGAEDAGAEPGTVHELAAGHDAVGDRGLPAAGEEVADDGVRRRKIVGGETVTPGHVVYQPGAGYWVTRHMTILARRAHAIIGPSGYAAGAPRDLEDLTMPSQDIPPRTLPSQESEPLYGGRRSGRITVRDIAAAKARGEKWPMLTAYDALTAGIFDEAGIPVLLVGDSAGNVVFGYETTIPVTVDDLIPLTAAVVRGTRRAMVVADLPFGSYQASPGEALHAAARFMKEAGAHAVKLEGGQRVAPHVEELVSAGVPVMGHVGLTPQSVHAFGGFRVQGRGSEAGDRLVHDAKALEASGAFAVVLEGIPSELGARITETLHIPTIGIGAGPECDAQVLVWQDMAGLSARSPKFAKRYADVAATLRSAASEFAADVASGAFPTEQYSYR